MCEISFSIQKMFLLDDRLLLLLYTQAKQNESHKQTNEHGWIGDIVKYTKSSGNSERNKILAR